ncbi:MAG: DUF6188 family protein [Actinomycetota bacterium]
MTSIELATVDQIILGHAVSFVRVGDGGGVVTIEGDFTVEVDGETHPVSPESIVGSGAILLGLLHQVVHAATVGDDGTLTLTIGSATVTVPPSADFEAWTYAAEDGRRVVCMPGGELAVWAGD